MDSKKKVLLVEDDLLLREIYVEALKEIEDTEVETAVDGEEALSKIQTGGWDLILLDVFIPKLNGFEVLDKLKESSQGEKLPLVFLTNASDEEGDVRHVKDLGYNIIVKSEITPGDLVDEVKRYLVIFGQSV